MPCARTVALLRVRHPDSSYAEWFVAWFDTQLAALDQRNRPKTATVPRLLPAGTGHSPQGAPPDRALLVLQQLRGTLGRQATGWANDYPGGPSQPRRTTRSHRCHNAFAECRSLFS